MKKSLLVPVLWWTLSCCYGQSLSPEVVAGSGKAFTSTEAQLSWTLGEAVTATFIGGDSAVLTQGFHQTNLIITSVEDLAAQIELRVYPNPVRDALQVRWEVLSEALTLELLDIQGRPLQMARPGLQSTSHQLVLSSYPSGTYLLRIRTERQLIKTYQILKIK